MEGNTFFHQLITGMAHGSTPFNRHRSVAEQMLNSVVNTHVSAK